MATFRQPIDYGSGKPADRFARPIGDGPRRQAIMGSDPLDQRSASTMRQPAPGPEPTKPPAEPPAAAHDEPGLCWCGR